MGTTASNFSFYEDTTRDNKPLESDTSNSDNCTITKAQIQYLIGDLKRLTPTARKLFNLGKECLTKATLSFDSSSQHELSSSQTLHDADFKLFKPLQLTQPIFTGQTYVKWRSVRDVQNFYAFCAPVKTVIYIQPIDDFPDFIKDFTLKIKHVELNMFSLLQSFCQIFFSGFDAHVQQGISLTEKQWQIKSRNHHITDKKQYFASDFFPYLQKLLPSNALCVLGLIWTDLYPEEDLNFVLGESSFNHKAAIFCFGRYEPKGFEKKSHKDIEEIDGSLVWKLIRVMSHEICHLLGFQHCSFFHCAMNESTSIHEAINQPLFLCPVCLRKLQKCCGFSVLERYKDMLVFLKDVQIQLPCDHLETSINWLEKCIAFLND